MKRSWCIHYWNVSTGPDVPSVAKEWCRTCPKCVTRKTSGPKRIAELKTIHTGYPMQVVAVDIMGPLPTTTDGNRYVLVAGDCFTKWVEAYAIPNQEAGTVAKKLVDKLFCRFSPPEQLPQTRGDCLSRNFCRKSVHCSKSKSHAHLHTILKEMAW